LFLLQRGELERAQQMVGGASSSREDPRRSILEGQLAAAAARAEDALAQLREWVGVGAEDRPGADDRAGGGDGGATPTPRGSGGDTVAPGGGALAAGRGGGGVTARRGWGPPHAAGGGEASQRHAVIRDEGARESPGPGRTQPFGGEPERYPERVRWALSDRFLRTAEERGGGATTHKSGACGERGQC
ncbi:hypothetical protein Taro_052381, partial [Colocasia esculenta]|nr:hypothetical protein [Colocasia esculenta]